MLKDINVSFTIENIDEYKELLRKAAYHSEQLEMIMEQIKNFDFKVKLTSAAATTAVNESVINVTTIKAKNIDLGGASFITK